MNNIEKIDLFNDTSGFQNRLVNELLREVNSKLEQHILNKLKTLGYDFETYVDLCQFASNRLTRIKHESSNLCEVFLDYNTINRQFVGCYAEGVESSFEDNKVTFTINVG